MTGRNNRMFTDSNIVCYERLKKLADEYLDGGVSPWGAAPIEVELDAMKLEQLRALGYVIK